jgi:CheY-like chemotaxis protein
MGFCRTRGGTGVESTFSFTLPFEPVGKDVCFVTQPPLQPTTGPDARILLAEDNPLNQKLALRILEKAGHEVVLARDGAEAVALFQSSVFDLIQMDIQMPILDGEQATTAIRMLDKGKSIPIVALTAHAKTDFRDQCIANGMTGFVSKPFDRAELLSIINRLLQNRNIDYM